VSESIFNPYRPVGIEHAEYNLMELTPSLRSEMQLEFGRSDDLFSYLADWDY
jgi:hypothetical protein